MYNDIVRPIVGLIFLLHEILRFKAFQNVDCAAASRKLVSLFFFFFFQNLPTPPYKQILANWESLET